MNPLQPFKKIASALAALVFSSLGTDRAARLLGFIVQAAADSREPGQRLRLLLDLDNRLYGLTGRAAVDYGEGLHPKHRLTAYHDFFVERVGPGERVLDVGCGVGALAFDLAERAGAEVVGVDLSREAIEQARERHAHPRVTYLAGRAEEVAPDRFEVVVLSNVLEHLDHRPDFLRKLKEMTGAGRWLIRVPLFERDWRVPLKKELGVEWRLDSTHLVEYTLESFDRELDQAGLATVHRKIRWGEIWTEVRPK